MKRASQLCAWFITIAVVVLYGLGVVRFESSSRPLQWMDSKGGWIYSVSRLDQSGRADQWVDRAAQWVGAPDAPDDQTPKP